MSSLLNLSQSTKQNTARLKAQLKVQQNLLETAFLQHKNAAQLLKKNSQLIDVFLKQIWLQPQGLSPQNIPAEAGFSYVKPSIHKDVCLIAVGGYGRQELFPFSDIDLLFLLPNQHDAIVNQQIEVMIGMLWDIGLNVGHSVRTLDECVSESAQDVTVQTNLLESRLLIGSKVNYQLFASAINAQMQATAFFVAKFKEQDNRHAKFNDTAYNLEPNIKESPGGLRDLHMILWLAQSQHLGQKWTEIAKNKLISTTELRQIKRHERNLQTLRIRLHYLAKRREDRLLFDFQNALADDLGFVTNANKRASEQLMQSYYRSVNFICLINEILLKALESTLSKTTPIITPINSHFEAHNQWLEAKTPRTLQKHPAAILESFLLLQQHPELTGMGANLLRELQRVKKLVNRDFRDSAENKALFLNILSQENGVNHSLRRMNRYGILGQYITAFGKIIGQMQHDLFHVYTVDEHILNVMANLRRFAKPALKHEFPLCSELFAAFEKPHLLYLAALFHDIAKGRGGDHSSLGMKDARRFCKRHGLHREDTNLVSWLVEAHLKMSSTAQKMDLSDPAVIEQFAQLVKTEKRLQALYLLTVADIRGTSPAVWNAWKARLLESLYYATKRMLGEERFSLQQSLQLRQEEAANKLAKYGLQAKSYQALWNNVGDAYFLRFEADEIAWQSRLLTPHVFTNAPIVRARLSPSGDGIQAMIYTRDQADLFARICNFFDRMAYSIVQAKIYTTNHGYALNSFIVLDQSGKSVSYSGLLKFIEAELNEKILISTPLEEPLSGRVNRQVKHMPFATQVNISAEKSSNMHTLELITADRPGLLAKVAFIFLQLRIDLHNAKINTLGKRAEDIFLVSDKQGKALNSAQIDALFIHFNSI